MDTLFPLDPITPPGFRYADHLITIDEERTLIGFIEEMQLRPFHFQGYTAKRNTLSFGYGYSFEKKQLIPTTPVPAFLLPYIEKMAVFAGIDPTTIVTVLITEYPPGAVINWHRDAPPFDIILGLSLVSSCTFRFRPYEKEKQGRGSIIGLELLPRSAYMISGEARSEWEHSIAPVAAKRYSVTCRTLRTTVR